MKKITSDTNGLAGSLLIAMPSMTDPRFERSVVFVCAHGSDGAMGLIVNKPAPGLMLNDLLEQLDIETSTGARNIRVHFGGPVENSRGFVLHSEDFVSEQSSLSVLKDYRLTATLDVLEALASGHGPVKTLLALGYSGWGPGQLEAEIRANGWLTAPPDPALVFAENTDTVWHHALNTIGIDPAALSTEGGCA